MATITLSTLRNVSVIVVAIAIYSSYESSQSITLRCSDYSNYYASFYNIAVIIAAAIVTSDHAIATGHCYASQSSVVTDYVCIATIDSDLLSQAILSGSRSSVAEGTSCSIHSIYKIRNYHVNR